MHGLLQSLQPRAECGRVVLQLRPAQADETQLCAHARVRIQRHVSQRRLDTADVCKKLRRTDFLCKGVERSRIVSAGEQLSAAARRDSLHQYVPQQHAQLIQQRRRVFPVLPELAEQHQRLRCVSCCDASQQLRRTQMPGKPHCREHNLRGDVLAAGALVQQRQRVAHPAVRQPRQQRGGVVLQVDLLLPSHIAQPRRDLLGGNALEAVPLAAGQDRCRDLVQFRRRQNEHQMLRRLFENFQQRVERRGAEHMHLVNDVHAFFDVCRGEDRFVAQGAHVVHAVVGRRVQLHHVEHRAVVDAAAGRAPVARIAVHRVLTVDRLSQNFGAGGLARAARADKQVCMGQPPGLHLMLQRFGDMGLPDHVVKRFRTPFAVKRLIHADDSPPSKNQKT